MNKIPKILFVTRDDGGCGFYRCQQPANFIRRMGLAETTVKLRSATEAELLAADLVILQEMGSVSASDTAQFCLASHIPYISEVDDFLHHVSPHNTAGYPAWNPSTLYVHRSMQQISSGMALTVSTDALAREYFPYQPLIYIVPNFLDEELWKNPVIRHSDGKIRIGWAGGNAHADDLKMIGKALEKLVKEFKGKVIFETMGMTKAELAGVFPMTELGQACPSCGYEGELHHYPGESLKDYPMVLASKGWDIAVAPVISNAFGNTKSDIKIKEYAAIGVPVVASSIAPYRDAARDGAQIAFASSFEEWYNELKTLIKSPKKRGQMARLNREWVAKYWIADNARHIFGVYSQILARAESLLGPRPEKK